MTETLSEQDHLERVAGDARQLAASVQAAETAGVSPALVLPTLFTVFQEAGMMPASLDLGGILGMMG